MNGPEHYREAERVASAALSEYVANDQGFTGWTRLELTALAQVHATLALAAATIDAQRGGCDVWGSWPAVQS